MSTNDNEAVHSEMNTSDEQTDEEVMLTDVEEEGARTPKQNFRYANIEKYVSF